MERDSGDLLVYLAKSDAFDINALPIKVGRLRLSFSPPLWTPETSRNGSWAQTLTVTNGTVAIQATAGYRVSVVVDANAPVLRVTGDHVARFQLRAALELVHPPSNWYRNMTRSYHDLTRVPDSPLGPFNASAPNTNPNGFGSYCLERFLEPDTVVGSAELSGIAGLSRSVVWYHRNVDTAPAHGVPALYNMHAMPVCKYLCVHTIVSYTLYGAGTDVLPERHANARLRSPRVPGPAIKSHVRRQYGRAGICKARRK